MPSERFIRRCRSGYAALLRFYPKAHRERFGETMAQTFNDLCRERVQAKRGLFGFALWLFAETTAAIIRENLTIFMRNKIMVRPVLVTGLILVIPLLGNRFVDGWNWSPGGFVVLGT